MQKIAIILIFTALIILSILFKDVISNIIHITKVEEGESVEFKAGKTIQFEIKNPYNETTSICELRVPTNYSKNKETPIFVWFNHGGGSYNVKNVPEFVDFDEYFVLALPYLDNQLPRIAIKEGHIDELWEYDRPMLEYVINLIPNLHSNIKIAGGFSSGAHFVASGLDRDWEGFTDFFTGYIIHEGGYAPEMTYQGIQSSDDVLVTYGSSIDSYGKLVAEMMKQYHSNITEYAVPDTGHEITPQTIEYIRDWVDERFDLN